MVLAIFVLLASIIVGQAFRLNLPGQGGGLLLSDIAVILVLLAALWHSAFNKPPSKILLTFTPFIAWSLFTLLIRLPELGLNHSLIAAAYWARLSSHLLLIPALLIIFQTLPSLQPVIRAFIVTAVILATLGFLQLWVIPDFSDVGGLARRSLGAGGWDPHQSRLTSTWLDPNFFGAYLAIVLPPIFILTPRPRRLVVCAVILLALILTQSRSALLALALALLLASPFISTIIRPPHNTRRHTKSAWRIALTSSTVIFLILSALTGLYLSDRLLGLISPDATVQLRLASLSKVWPIAAARSLFGVGYNAYQFAALEAGLISDFNIHSRAGADNSWLTLWVTTGLPGLILFVAPWLVAIQLAWRRFVYKQSTLPLAAMISLITLLIHSQFVNSFLYSHLLITIAFIMALVIYEPDPA